MRQIDYKKRDRKRLGEGRGDFERPDYLPWKDIYSQDAPSSGEKSTYRSRTEGRTLHLMTKAQRVFAILTDNQKDTLNIREQVALTDQVMTMKIADELGVNHPCYKDTDTPQILTIPFMVRKRRKNGSEWTARMVISSPRTLEEEHFIERLEIMRQYWQRKGVADFKIVTMKDMDEHAALNIEHACHCSEKLMEEFNPEYLEHLKKTYLEGFRKSGEAVWRFNARFDKDNSLETGTANMIFHALTFERKIRVDFKTDPDFKQICSEVAAC